MLTLQTIIDDYYRFLKERNRDALVGLLSEHIKVTYHASGSALPWAGEYAGVAGFDEFLTIIKNHLDIVEVNVLDRTYGDKKAVMQCYGTWEVKENGNKISGFMVNVFTVENQQITHYEVYADTAAFERGISVIRI